MSDKSSGNDLNAKIQNKLDQEQRQIGAALAESDSRFSEADIYKAAVSQQDGDAWLFCQLYKNILVYDHAAAKWYEWKGHYWEEDKVEEVTRKLDAVIDIYGREASEWSWKKLAALRQGEMQDADKAERREKEYLKKISTLQKRRWKEDVLRLAAAGKQSLGITGEEWDNIPYLLPCINGIIELQTGNFRPGKQTDFIKTVCPSQWKGLYEPCPAWEQFLHEIFGDSSLPPFLRRLCGYAAAGVPTKHILPIFWGHGRNGKGTFFNLLHHTIGPLAGPVQAEILLEQRQFRSSSSPNSDIMALRGKRIVWASETDEGRKLNAGKAKWLSGDDLLCGREPYGKREINFKPTHILFLQTNHKPKADPNDFALWQRLHLIPFTMSFIDNPNPLKPDEKKQDHMLPEKLKAEASGILAWLVRGFLEWQEQGLNPPKIVQEATEEYQEGEDILGHFISDSCILGSGRQVKAGDLYQAYSQWCNENGHKSISGTKFGERMKERYEHKKTMGYIFYYGIGLKI